MIHKDSSKHVICSMCSAEADPGHQGPEPLCKLHAGTLMSKQSNYSSKKVVESIRELANTGDAHHADE